MAIILNFDGASQGNPGPAEIGVVIYNTDTRTRKEISEYIGSSTNNIAEYKALIHGLDTLLQSNIENADINIMGDSQLVVFQVTGAYSVNAPHLYKLYSDAKGKIDALCKKNRVSVRWIPRDKNKEADRLSNICIASRSNNPTNSDVTQDMIINVGDGIYKVKSSSGKGFYAVDTNNMTCSCPAFMKRKYTVCKHLNAVLSMINVKAC